MKSIILIFCSILLLIGCGSDETGVPTEAIEPLLPNYFPDAVGSRWVYRGPDDTLWAREVKREQIFDGNLYPVFDYTPFTEEMGFSYLKPTSYRVTQNQVFFSVREKIYAYVETELPKILQDEFEGLELNVTVENISEHELAFCYIPLMPNFQWEALRMKVSGTLVLQNLVLLQIPFKVNFRVAAQVVGENRLQTPAGIFEKTYQIVYQTEIITTVFEQTEITESVQKVWIAPHIGIVKVEDESGATELIEYVLLP